MLRFYGQALKNAIIGEEFPDPVSVSQNLIIWQAFEPPLDMSQDIDCCENSHLEDAPNDHGSSGAQDACACHPTSTSGRSCFSKSNQACCEEESNLCNSPRGVIANKVYTIVIPTIAFLMNGNSSYGSFLLCPFHLEIWPL